MRAEAGYTFIELMVVLGVIAVLASFSITLVPNVIKPRSLALEAETLGTEIFLLVSTARATRKTMQLVCEPNVVKVNIYDGIRSNFLSLSGEALVGLDARVQTQSKAYVQKVLLSERSKVNVSCPQNCGDLFISSDGYLLSQERCPAIEYVLSKQPPSTAQVKLTLSSVGYPRVLAKASPSQADWSEVSR
jgi:prepilin-type N-terminal cleavage/methylation domain-containing protein